MIPHYDTKDTDDFLTMVSRSKCYFLLFWIFLLQPKLIIVLSLFLETNRNTYLEGFIDTLFSSLNFLIPHSKFYSVSLLDFSFSNHLNPSKDCSVGTPLECLTKQNTDIFICATLSNFLVKYRALQQCFVRGKKNLCIA